ncbi:hypothetical protein VH441_09245 [Psychrobacter sp. HD31]|uniref:hypothetical protein n=1 Tax=Psychrobacter sp. HD31 TaxID=3112003 RepID=UPI003DA3A336
MPHKHNDTFDNPIANTVDNHLAQLEQAITNDTALATIEDAQFNEAELANIINPKRLEALLNQSDAFLSSTKHDIDEFKD